MSERELDQQLRDQAKKLGEMPRGIAWGYALLMEQAADEIEWLRADPDEARLLRDQIQSARRIVLAIADLYPDRAAYFTPSIIELAKEWAAKDKAWEEKGKADE